MASTLNAPTLLTLPAEIRTQILCEVFGDGPAPHSVEDTSAWQSWYRQPKLAEPLRLICKTLAVDVEYAEKNWRQKCRNSRTFRDYLNRHFGPK